MYGNIGGKIKVLATVICIIGAVATILYGVLLCVIEQIALGLAVMIVGPVLSWVSSFALYGFGQLVQNSDRLVSNAEQSLALQQSCKDDLDRLTEEALSKKANP